MSDPRYVGPSVLAGIKAAALVAYSNPTLVGAQAFGRPSSVLVFDVAERLLNIIGRHLFDQSTAVLAIIARFRARGSLQLTSASLKHSNP